MNLRKDHRRFSASLVMALDLLLGGSRAGAQVKKPPAPAKVTAPAKQKSTPKNTPPSKPPVRKEVAARPKDEIKPNISHEKPLRPSSKPDRMTTEHTKLGDVSKVNGRVSDVHTKNGMDIHRNLGGGRRVAVERADHSRIVAERGGRGYIEHPYRYHDREFAHRTYYYNGRAYDHYYGRYQYHGVYVNYYTPGYYYRPAFYGWAYNPWVAPMPYAWDWAGNPAANPWYGYYGYYFTPYPVYPSASAWLTDYMISASLAAAYEAQVQAAQTQGGPPPDAAPLTPEVKEMISAEVKRQIALENAEAQNAQTAVPDPASSSVQRILTDGQPHVFLVGNQLDLTNSAGAECAVSQGDALQLVGPPPPDSPTASTRVLSSKGGVECRKSDTVAVQIADLQEMQNHMRETIDAGMGELQKPGNKLPAIPTRAQGPPVKATFMTDAPPPDPNVAQEINQQLVAADQAEKDVTETQSANTPPVAAQPIQISLGESIDQVTAALGQPVTIVELGEKKIYVYKQEKISFKDNKVSDVR